MEREMKTGQSEVERDMEERTPYRTLLEAAMSGTPKKMEELRSLLQDDPAILDGVIRDCRGNDNPLHVGAQHGNEEFVREILDRKPELTRELNSDGQSPLHLSSARGHVEVVKEILSKDADACFLRDRDGMIPLHLAAINGRVEVLEKLVKAVEITAFILTKRGEPILHLCANNDKFEALKKLIELGKDVPGFVNLRDRDDNTILHLLAAKEKLEVMSVFAGKGFRIDADAVNKDGHTPLDVALLNANGLEFGRLKVQFWLVVCGARRLKLSRIISTINPERMFDGNDGKWFVEALLVVSVLMVSVAFQAGISPPGGVWQDTGYHNASQSSALKLVHHCAGQSVMSYVDPIRYEYFSMFNNITLSSSMLVIVMLLRRWHLSLWIFKLAPIVFTFISVWAMSTAYSISVSFISSVEEDSHSDRRKISSTTSLLLLGIFFTAYFINILHAGCLLIIWSSNVPTKLYEAFDRRHRSFKIKGHDCAARFYPVNANA
ncbi:hypothetical protein AAC387_Pa07g0424 [Persea americana]